MTSPAGWRRASSTRGGSTRRWARWSCATSPRPATSGRRTSCGLPASTARPARSTRTTRWPWRRSRPSAAAPRAGAPPPRCSPTPTRRACSSPRSRSASPPSRCARSPSGARRHRRPGARHRLPAARGSRGPRPLRRLGRARRAARRLGGPAGALEARAASLAAYERAAAPSPERRAITWRASRRWPRPTAPPRGRPRRRSSRCGRTASPRPTPPPPSPSPTATSTPATLSAAYALYERVLSPRRPSALTDGERLHATYRRGALALRLGRGADAMADLQAALAHRPAPPRRAARARPPRSTPRAAWRPPPHYIQALLVEPDASRRGSLYARLGRLWEDKLASAEEAGVCYDLSITASSAQPAASWRP